MFWCEIEQIIMSKFHSLEAVGRGGETQLLAW